MSFRRIRILRPKSASISNTPCFPERVAVVAEVIGITSAIGISMRSAIGIITIPGTEELQEHLTWTGMRASIER